MSRILAYTSPARGHLYPLTPILDELAVRGHEIVLRTLASEVAMLRARGFDAMPIAEEIERCAHTDFQARTPQGAIKRALRNFARRAEFEVPDLQGAIAATDPDALLVDINTWGAQAMAEASAMPWASWCPYPIPLDSPEVPPFGPGFAPARGPAGRLRDALVRPLVAGSFAKAFVPAVNQVRATVGVPALPGPTAQFERAPLVLYLTAEPFEYPRTRWPENIVMVGPCAWEPPADVPGWLGAVERPTVLVTTSSEFQDDGRLVRCALEALTDGMFVVATLPAQEVGDFRVPANARVERFLPHGPILERATCAVTHAGMGATQKALSRGVPVCAVPFGRDQMEVARRVEVAGAGSRLVAKRLTPGRLRDKVREAIACRDGARRVAHGYEAAGGAPAAADAVENRLLKQQPRTSRALLP